MSQINTTLVAQSALSLVVAITVADTIRECFNLLKPEGIFGMIVARLALVVLVLIGACIFYEWHSKIHHEAPDDHEQQTMDDVTDEGTEISESMFNSTYSSIY